MKAITTEIPVVPWRALLPAIDWQQGEHITLVGPTGQGKTTLMKALLPAREWVTMLATKPSDSTLEALKRQQGFQQIEKWPPKPDQQKVLLWPKMQSAGDVAHQAAVVRHALEQIFEAGGWCIGSDEARYVCQQLGCKDLMELLWLQGRALGISIVAATQRPRHLPLEAFSQATHLFLWGNNDKYDRERLAGLGRLDSLLIQRTLATLPEYTVLYLNTRKNVMAITRAPR